MDLQHPEKKMSKSEISPQGTIGLFDDPKEIERKVKRAVTDTDDGAGAVRYDPVSKPGVSNLLEILATIQGRTPTEVAEDYTQYGPLKADLAKAVVGVIEPIQEGFRRWEADPATVSDVLQAGASKADDYARKTLARAYDAIGLLAPG